MKASLSTHSIHASIQDIIIKEDRKKLRCGQVNQLFTAPDLNEIDTNEFHRHPYMFKNQFFTFFVHQLEKWNKKIKNKQVTPFYHAELKKYNFIHSSLKIISLKKPTEINHYLEQLSVWYSKNSYNIPQPSVLMKKYDISQEWEVRKTFKSNTPSEIYNYRRRFFCSPEDKVDCLKNLGIPTKKENCFLKNSTNYKLKHSLSSGFMETMNDDKFRISQAFQPFKEINQNNQKKKLKKQNTDIRKHREQNEINSAQSQWKNSQSRFGQKSCKNFYQGKFKTNKHYSQSTARMESRKIFTASFNIRNSQQQEVINKIKKRRLQTSLGFRTSFTNQQSNQTNLSDKSNENITNQSKQVTKQTVQNWIENYVVNEENLTIRNTFYRTGTAIKLLSNPFENAKSKIKRKKKQQSKK